VRVRRRIRFVVGGAIIALVVGVLLFSNLQSSTVYYLTVKEFKAQAESIGGRKVRVAGIVDRETVDWRFGSTTLRFDMVEDGESLTVTYAGPVPDAFAQAEGVVVEGTYSPEGIFLAETLIVQCPSKYETRLTPEE
jgi:cytochrome c-type biogenesis protein CcmE